RKRVVVPSRVRVRYPAAVRLPLVFAARDKMHYRARTAYKDPAAYDRRRGRTLRHRLIRGQEDRIMDDAWREVASPGGRGLDVAGGSGRITARCVERGFTVAGADVSAAMLAGARAKLAGAEGVLGFARCDATALPFPDRYFDGVTCFRLMGHLPPPVRAA